MQVTYIGNTIPNIKFFAENTITCIMGYLYFYHYNNLKVPTLLVEHTVTCNTNNTLYEILVLLSIQHDSSYNKILTKCKFWVGKVKFLQIFFFFFFFFGRRGKSDTHSPPPLNLT